MTQNRYPPQGLDFTQTEDDGTIVNHGSATTWDDVVGSLIGKRLNSVAGSVAYNYAENAVTFRANGDVNDDNDVVNVSLQYPHKAKVTGVLKAHIHWEQIDATDREFTIQYRVQKNGASKTTTWTTVVVGTNANNVFPYTLGVVNQITPLATIDMTGAGISATIQFRLTRSDAIAGNVDVTFFDCHYEIDTQGSRQEYIK